MAQLDHPHVAWVYDVGTIPDDVAAENPSLLAGTPWMALELAERGPLTDNYRDMSAQAVQVLLHEVLDGSRAWSAIQVVLDRGGVLAGCSAGAMVQGAKIAGLRGGGETDGFALLPGTMIIPHFDEWPSLISGLVRRVVGRGHTVVGIEGGTAMVRHGGEHRAVGIGGVEVWGPLGHRRFERELLPAGFIDPIT